MEGLTKCARGLRGTQIQGMHTCLYYLYKEPLFLSLGPFLRALLGLSLSYQRDNFIIFTLLSFNISISTNEALSNLLLSEITP